VTELQQVFQMAHRRHTNDTMCYKIPREDNICRESPVLPWWLLIKAHSLKSAVHTIKQIHF